MNNSFYAKITVFLVIELIGFGLIFKNQEITFFGIFTAIALLFLFLDPKYFKNISNIKEKLQKNNLNSFIKSDFADFIKYLFIHWGFVLSVITLVLAIFDTFVLKFFNINLIFSFFFFIVSLWFVYKDIMIGNIYLWNQKISSKDILFIMSGLLSISIYVFLKKLPAIDKWFFSIVSWFWFYITMVYSLGYGNTNMRLFKSKVITIYLILLISFSGLFTYSKIQGNIQKEKSTINKENKKPLINTEKKQTINTNNEDRFITYTAPNKKLYDIHVTTTGAWFLWYNAEKKFFENIEGATKVINLANPLLSGNTWDSNSLSWNTEETDMMIWQLIDLFEEKDIEEPLETIDQIEENTLTGEDTTYYDLIPLIINKFQLNSNTKANVIFDNVSNSDENYDYFKTAYYYKMIWRNFNPKSKVQCKTVAVFIWLAENSDTNYTSTDVFTVFWKLIDEEYHISECCKEEDYVKKSKITCIFK